MTNPSASTTTLTVVRWTDFRRAIVAAAIATAGLVASGVYGTVSKGSLSHRLTGVGGAAVFLVFAVLATRATAGQIRRHTVARLGPGHAGTLALLVSLVGYLLILLMTLGLLNVPVQHLLLGGAIAGVILGIAGQQTLGNVFAGLVLLLARPFTVGQSVVIRTGSLGGVLTGVVTGMGLTYVTLQTTETVLSLPNSAVLGAAVGPDPAGPGR